MSNKRQKNQRFISYAFFPKNHKAQVSEIMSWVIATLVIITVLIIFIYVSSLLAQKTKTVKAQELKVDLGDKVNLLETKNSITYNSASDSEKAIIDKWKEDNADEK